MVCVELMGVSRVGHAYGLLLFFMGIAGAMGPPLAGELLGQASRQTETYKKEGRSAGR